MTERAEQARLDADKVRRAHPLRFVQVKPYLALPACVLMRRGTGQWEIRTVAEAIEVKREWKLALMRKRKEKLDAQVDK
jgi:hypothetical protein